VRRSGLIDALHAAVLLEAEYDAARAVPGDDEYLAQRELGRVIGTAEIAGLELVFLQQSYDNRARHGLLFAQGGGA
jgi:hypothetical protein